MNLVAEMLKTFKTPVYIATTKAATSNIESLQATL